MRKIILLILCISTAVCFASCGTGGNGGEETIKTNISVVDKFDNADQFVSIGDMYAANSKYTVQISNGESSVEPLYCLRSTVTHNKSSGAAMKGIGDGYYGVLKPDSNRLTEVPSLTLTENLSMTYSTSGKLGEIIILDSEFNNYELSDGGAEKISDLSRLSKGEWYIAVQIEWQGDYVAAADAHDSAVVEYVFKLIVE